MADPIVTPALAGLLLGGSAMQGFFGALGSQNTLAGMYAQADAINNQTGAQFALGQANLRAAKDNMEINAMLGREAQQAALYDAAVGRQWAYNLGPTRQYDLQRRAKEIDLTKFAGMERGNQEAQSRLMQAMMNTPEQKAFEERQSNFRIKEALAPIAGRYASLLGPIAPLNSRSIVI